MKQSLSGWPIVIAALMLTLFPGAVQSQVMPPLEPILRIETGMHSAVIRRIGVDASCRLLVTASEDKTARLWALPESGTGEATLLHIFRVPIGPDNGGKVFAVALSPDSRFIAAGGWDVTNENAVYIFDVETGKIVRRLGRLNNVIYHLTFSPDGKYLAATLWGGEGVRVWATNDWSLAGEDRDYGRDASYGAIFDKDNRLYTVNYDGFLRRYGRDFKLDAKIKTLGGKEPYSVAIHPNGDRIAVGFDGQAGIDVYSTKDLKRQFSIDTAGFEAYGVTWSADGSHLFAGGRDVRTEESRLRIWDKEGRGTGHEVAAAQDTIMQLAPCRNAVAVSAQDPAFGLISDSGEKKVWQQSAKPDMRGKRGADFTVSDDGSKVRFGLGVFSRDAVQFDVTTGRLIESPQPSPILFPPVTEGLPVSDWLHNVAPKFDRKVLVLQHNEESRSLAIAPDADRFVIGAEWSLRAYGRDGKALWQKQVPGISWGVNIPRAGKFVVAAYGDGTIRWLRLSDGEEVLALFVNAKTREWVMWTPQGYYTSSVSGDQSVGWHLNKGWEQAGEFVTAARLKRHLYRPDIIKRAFDLADADRAVREAGLSNFSLVDLVDHAPPEFHITEPKDKARSDKSPVELKLAIAAAKDPVTGYEITVNGRQVTTRDVRGSDDNTNSTPAQTTAHLRTISIPLEQGENRVQVAAHNAVGDSVEELLVYLNREGALNKKGKLLILAIGVDKYEKLGAKNTLRYSGADAGLIVETLAQRAGTLHTQVKPVLLVSGGTTSPTRANIEDALALFREAGPEDTVVLFLAGHGVTEGADYLFLPEDADDTGGHWRPSSVINWQILQRALQNAQGRRIMFVDTCHAGGAYNARLIKDAADANIVVFSATDQETLAQERSTLGHGVFTYALAKGLNGGADVFKRGTINILALGSFVANEVKSITNDEQEPTFNLSGSKDFVLAAP